MNLYTNEDQPKGLSAISWWLRSIATTPPDHRAPTTRIPEGCQPTRSTSIQIPILIVHLRRLQKLRQLLPKRLYTVVLSLVRDVTLHLRTGRRADSERSIPFLPGEPPQSDGFMNPSRGRLFKLQHEIGQAMGGLQSNELMHVIGHASYPLRNAAQPRHRAAEVFMQAIPQGRIDHRCAVLRGEYEVEMESKKRRGHGGRRTRLASLPDAGLLRIVSGGVASLNHRLMAWMPPASRRAADAFSGMPPALARPTRVPDPSSIGSSSEGRTLPIKTRG